MRAVDRQYVDPRPVSYTHLDVYKRQEAVGAGVTHLKPGDRAAFGGSNPPGAYSEARVMNAAMVVPLPDCIGFDTAAAMMLKGLTVNYLFRRTFPL